MCLVDRLSSLPPGQMLESDWFLKECNGAKSIRHRE